MLKFSRVARAVIVAAAAVCVFEENITPGKHETKASAKKMNYLRRAGNFLYSTAKSSGKKVGQALSLKKVRQVAKHSGKKAGEGLDCAMQYCGKKAGEAAEYCGKKAGEGLCWGGKKAGQALCLGARCIKQALVRKAPKEIRETEAKIEELEKRLAEWAVGMSHDELEELKTFRNSPNQWIPALNAHKQMLKLELRLKNPRNYAATDLEKGEFDLAKLNAQRKLHQLKSFFSWQLRELALSTEDRESLENELQEVNNFFRHDVYKPKPLSLSEEIVESVWLSEVEDSGKIFSEGNELVGSISVPKEIRETEAKIEELEKPLSLPEEVAQSVLVEDSIVILSKDNELVPEVEDSIVILSEDNELVPEVEDSIVILSEENELVPEVDGSFVIFSEKRRNHLLQLNALVPEKSEHEENLNWWVSQYEKGVELIVEEDSAI